MRFPFKIRQSIPVLVFFCVVITAGVSAFAIYPWVMDINRMRGEIMANEVLLEESLLPKVKLLKSLDEGELDSSITILEETIPSFSQEWSVLASLEEIAADSAVELGMLNVAGVADDLIDKTKTGIVQVPVIASGDNSQIIAFLKNTERAKRVLALNGFEFKTDDEVIKLQAKVNAPYLPVPTELGAIETQLEGLTMNDQVILSQISRLNLYGFSVKKVNTAETDIIFGKLDPF